MCSGVCTCRPQRWRVRDGDEAGGGEGSILAEGDSRSDAERGIDTGVLPSFPAAVEVYLCTVACDMRRSFDGLSMMAEHVIGCNPFCGHLLVFCNRRGDRLKILYWDRDGWAIWYK